MDIRAVFGANVRRYRLANRLSQEAVAERMGVDRAYISGIERGKQNATLLTIWQASLALKVRPVDLLTEDVFGIAKATPAERDARDARKTPKSTRLKA